MAALYIAMTRCVGIRSSYVYVAVNDSGGSVNHACAMVDLPGAYRPVTLVDLSYPRFDANHGKFRPYTDFEIFQKFNTGGSY